MWRRLGVASDRGNTDGGARHVCTRASPARTGDRRGGGSRRPGDRDLPGGAFPSTRLVAHDPRGGSGGGTGCTLATAGGDRRDLRRHGRSRPHRRHRVRHHHHLLHDDRDAAGHRPPPGVGSPTHGGGGRRCAVGAGRPCHGRGVRRSHRATHTGPRRDRQQLGRRPDQHRTARDGAGQPLAGGR